MSVINWDRWPPLRREEDDRKGWGGGLRWRGSRSGWCVGWGRRGDDVTSGVVAVALLGVWAICSSGRMGCDWEVVIDGEGALETRKVAD
jgi:hypothetical protein